MNFFKPVARAATLMLFVFAILPANVWASHVCDLEITSAPEVAAPSDILDISVRVNTYGCGTNPVPAWQSTSFEFSDDGGSTWNNAPMLCDETANVAGGTEFDTIYPMSVQLGGWLAGSNWLVRARAFENAGCSEELYVENLDNIVSVFVKELNAEDDFAKIRVKKYFSDLNPAGATVHMKCNEGTPLTDSFELADGEFVEFTVGNLTDATDMHCEVWEEPITGYSADFTAEFIPGKGVNVIAQSENTACVFDQVTAGDYLSCAVSNTLEPVSVVVEKEWINGIEGELPVARLQISCRNKGKKQLSRKETITFVGDEYRWEAWVFDDVHYAGETCTITEPSLRNSSYEGEANGFCTDFEIYPGYESGNPDEDEVTDWCVWTNTYFFEGIPVMTRTGLAIMALLMLSMGAVGFRRLL